MDNFLDSPPFSVLQHFAPHTRGLSWQRAGAGFSGARVWRGDENGTPRIALKAWSAGTTPDRVRQIHAWLARVANVPFVPRVFRGADGHTLSAEAGRVWDACEWRPGEPRLSPSESEIALACEAVARLHDAWSTSTERGPCPGVANRLRILAENEPLLRAGPGALPAISPQLDPLLRRAVIAVARVAPLATRALRPWAHVDCVLQPCVRDLRAEHVLFERGQVAGVIDYGAMGVDHPAVDLARLLGDFASDRDALFATGLAVYQQVRATFDASEGFVRLLARSGSICSVLGWLVRLVKHREPVPDFVPLFARLARLVSLVEQIRAI